ncbi:MAG: PAS domain S-box protein [Anaerolineales bacterium]|nr:PAS domain S-box protein [Anaerolineales bacterium]
MKKRPNAEVRATVGKKLKEQEDTTPFLKKADLLQRIHDIEANLFELQKQNEKLEQARAEGEAAYRQYTDLYDFAPVGYCTLKRNGNILEVNLAGATLLGMEREKLIGSQLEEFVSAESHSAFKDFFEKLLSGTGKETCELTFKKSEPDLLWVRIEATCFEGGQESRAVMLSTSERKRAESELRVSVTKYKTLFDSFPLGITVSDAAGNILETNPAAVKLLGVPQEEHIQRDIDSLEWQIVRADGTPMPPEEFASVRALKENIRIENMEMGVVKPDGSITWISVTAAPLPLEGYGVVVTYGDITERKYAEQALQESEHRFRTTLEEVQTIAVQGYGMDGTTQYWNTASEKLYGYSAEEAIGKSLLELIIPPEMRGDVWQAIQQMAQTGQPIPAAELSLMRKDGSRVTVYSSHAITSIPGGAPELFCLDVDLTEQKRIASLLDARVRISEYADAHTLDDLLQKALDEAETITGSQIGFAHFIKEDQKTVQLHIWSTNTLENLCTAEGESKHSPVDEAGVWAECVSTRGPVIHNDYAGLPAARRKGLPEGHAPIVRELVVPILRNDLIVMIVGVGNKPYNYDENDVEALTQLAGLVWDIVQRKQAEEAVRETQELLSLFINHSPIYTFIKEVTPTESRVLQASNNFNEMIGIESADMIGRTMQELFPPDLAAKMTADDWDVVAKGQILKLDEDLNGHHYHSVKFPLVVGAKTLLAGYTIDITERVQAQNALQASEANLKAVFENSSQTFQVIDRNHKIQFFNQYAKEIGLRIFGKEVQPGDSVYEFIRPQDREGFDRNFDFALSGEARQVEKMFEVGNEILWFEFSFAPIRTEHEVIGVCFSSQNITRRKRAETILQESELFVKGVLNSLTAHIAVLDEQGVIISVNDAWVNFARENGDPHPMGFAGENYLAACEAAIRQGDPLAIQADQAIRAVLGGSLAEFSTEYPLESPTQSFWFAMTVLPQHKPRMGAIILHQNITERKQAEQEAIATSIELQTALIREQELARIDVLTGVNNRRHLYQQAEQQLHITLRYQQTLSVIMFDIDHFKRVNDTFGHEAGDQMLKLVTDTAAAELRSADVIGRYGGEEFIVILPLTNAQQAFQLAERIRANVASLIIPTPKGPARVTLSIGIVELNGSSSVETVEDIFRRADEAMYAAKQAGRNRTEIR